MQHSHEGLGALCKAAQWHGYMQLYKHTANASALYHLYYPAPFRFETGQYPAPYHSAWKGARQCAARAGIVTAAARMTAASRFRQTHQLTILTPYRILWTAPYPLSFLHFARHTVPCTLHHYTVQEGNATRQHTGACLLPRPARPPTAVPQGPHRRVLLLQRRPLRLERLVLAPRDKGVHMPRQRVNVLGDLGG